MLSKRRLLKNASVYLILDTEVNDYGALFEIARLALAGGADIFQLRDKKGLPRDIIRFSQKMMKIVQDKALYIVNDRLDLALIAGADGVHLGQEDIPLKMARGVVNKTFIIGASCQTLAHYKTAVLQGADYVGFGSVFKTKTKPDRDPMQERLLKKILHLKELPVFPIGGINTHNVLTLRNMGSTRAAICRAICEARDIKERTSFFKRILHAGKVNI